MYNKWIGFYNQNRYLVWIVIITIVSIIVLIHLLNSFVAKRNEENNSIISTMNSTAEETIKEASSFTVYSGKNTDISVTEVIYLFINYCNEGNIEEAYDLLSDECKKIMYPSLESFANNYYNRIFQSKKSFKAQSLISSQGKFTYQVFFSEDIIATGKASSKGIIDYYTVTKENNIYKLSINKLIGKEEINVSKTINSIDFNIIDKTVYRDYEIYTIKVTNNTSNDIKLDNLQGTRNIYVQDINKNEYIWFSHEYVDEDITVNRGTSRIIKLKFNKEYKPTLGVQYMVFSNIVLDNRNTFELRIKM